MVETTPPSRAPASTSERLRIDVWSDVVCPFCWIGKRHLEQGIERAGLAGQVQVVFRSFELNPAMRGSQPIREYLAKRFGSAAQAARIVEHVKSMGASAGLAMDFDRAIAASTFDAHRLSHLARERGVGDAVMDGLMRAHFAEGADVADPATLRRVATAAGLDGAEVDRVLASDAYADAVRADQAEARGYGIGGVPFFVVGGRYAISGAQPVELFAQTLARAQAEGAPFAQVGEAGASCADDACDLPVADDVQRG